MPSPIEQANAGISGLMWDLRTPDDIEQLPSFSDLMAGDVGESGETTSVCIGPGQCPSIVVNNAPQQCQGPMPPPPQTPNAESMRRLRARDRELSSKKLDALRADNDLLRAAYATQQKTIVSMQRASASDALTITYLRAAHEADRACIAMMEGHVQLAMADRAEASQNDRQRPRAQDF